MKLKILYLSGMMAAIILLFTSCNYIITALVFPNRCEKCKIIDKYTQEVVWSEEDCGGAVAGLEDRAKVEAYDRNSNSAMERYEVSCDTYSNK